MLVRDSMTQHFLTVSPERDLCEAAELMLSAGSESLLVMSDDSLVGVIGLRDLFTAPFPAAYGGRMHARRSEAQWRSDWQTVTVAMVMNREVITATEDMPVLRAAELMVNTGKHPLPVLRSGRVVGVVDRADIARALLSAIDASAGC